MLALGGRHLLEQRDRLRMQARGNDANGQGSAQFGVLLGRPGQKPTAVGEELTLSHQTIAGQAGQHVGLPLAQGLEESRAREVALQQHEHVCSDGAQQPEGQPTLSDAGQSGNGIDDGRGPDFHTQRRLQMRKRAGSAGGIGIAGGKAGAILRGVGHGQLGAIDAPQGQAKG